MEFLTDGTLVKSEYLHKYIMDCLKMNFKDQIENAIVQTSVKGPVIHLWLKTEEGCFVFNPQEQKYPKFFEEFRGCLVSKKEFGDIKEVSKLDQGVKAYINGNLSYNQGVRFPLTPENVPLVKDAHDKLQKKYGNQVNSTVQRGDILGQNYSSGSNVEPVGEKGGIILQKGGIGGGGRLHKIMTATAECFSQTNKEQNVPNENEI